MIEHVILTVVDDNQYYDNTSDFTLKASIIISSIIVIVAVVSYEYQVSCILLIENQQLVHISYLMTNMNTLIGLLVEIAKIYIFYRLIRTAFAFSWAVFIYFIAPIFYTPNFTKYKGRWTVITGCTDGIGKAYTIELAKRGIEKFILIGRNTTKLDNLATFLETTYKSRTKRFVFDFATDEYENLREYLAPIDIGIVINSVGVAPTSLDNYGDNYLIDRTLMSAVIPPMRSSGGGQIVNLSSSQAYRPVPLLAAYSASKSLISFLSETIDRESDNIRVQCLTPALVATNMTFYKCESLFVVSPEHFAQSAVRTFGLVSVTTGCFNHEIQLLLRHLFPWKILKYLIIPIYSFEKKRLQKMRQNE